MRREPANWQVHYRIFRFKRDGSPPRFDTFLVEIGPEETVLDGIERIWAFHDRSLTFRHACHHASCGTCGVRVNGIERLPCVTTLREISTNGGTLVVEPLRNFPVAGDLVVDPAPLFHSMRAIGMPIVRSVEPAGQPESFHRFENCIECGLCLSACPVAQTDPHFAGPAALAAAERLISEPRGADVSGILRLVDGEEGVWRCHTAFECTEACPSSVNPAGAIMALRARLISDRIRGLFRRRAPDGGRADLRTK